MNEMQKINAVHEVLWAAKEIIRQLDTAPSSIVRYDDFQTPELREMFYALNDMCLTLQKMRKEVAL